MFILKLFKWVVIALVLLIAYAFFTAVDVFAKNDIHSQELVNVRECGGRNLWQYHNNDFPTCNTGLTHKATHTSDQPVIVITVTPDQPVTPVIVPADDNPTNDDKDCKNKNSGKDGTPSECNAGGGQEKHS